MENAATDDTSARDASEHGHDDCSGGGGGQTAPQEDSVQSASTVTEVGNAAAVEEETARRPGLDDDGRGEDYVRVTTTVVDDDYYYAPVEAEMTVAVGAGVRSSSYSTVRLAASRFGCLLLGFVAGAAAAVLFLMRHESPVTTTCTVVPT